MAKCGFKTLLLIFLFCFTPRLIYFIAVPDRTYNDSIYWNAAGGLLYDYTFIRAELRDTTQDFLYVIFLYLARWFTFDTYFAAMIIQIIFECIGCVYLYKLTSQLAKSSFCSWTAVLLYSLHPYLVRQSVAIIEVPLLSALLIITCYYFVSEKFIRYSVLTGLTILCRPTLLPVFGFAIFILLFRRRLVDAFLTFFVPLLICLPFYLRNYHVGGVLLPARSGWNLIKGNCEYSDKVIPAYSVDLLDDYLSKMWHSENPGGEDIKWVDQDRFYTKKAVQFIKENPLRTLKLRLLNILYLYYPGIVPFNPVDNKTKLVISDGGIRVENVPQRGRLADLAYSVYFTPLFLLFLAGMYIRRASWKKEYFLYLIIICFTAVYSVYWPGTRLRAPMDFILIFFAACALEKFYTIQKRMAQRH
ncbi:MAG: hypothetical protein HY606_03420 [Planctomycetes bacterium]|nr:hypothetical protein [Planctomycetota bacterium]